MTSGGQQVKTLVVAVALMMIAGFAPAMVLGVLGHASSANVAVLAGMAVLIVRASRRSASGPRWSASCSRRS